MDYIHDSTIGFKNYYSLIMNQGLKSFTQHSNPQFLAKPESWDHYIDTGSQLTFIHLNNGGRFLKLTTTCEL